MHEIIRSPTSNYLPLAKKWLQECIGKHENCVKAVQQVLPTRLICLEGNNVCLIYTTPGVHLKYATLSYSWGSIKFIRLLKENFYDLQKHIPESQLTKTFSDAIHITRSLGLEYIWIDSLCIIQDDIEDWRRVAPQMSRVYGGSTINIAASSSLDGNGGCIYDDADIRSTRKAFRYRLKMKDERPWELLPLRLYQNCTIFTHLASRAWCFQERLLAPRTLHFSKTDMFWECYEKDACGLYPNGLPQCLCEHRRYQKKAPLASIWFEIMEMYSAAKLTVASDKLIALSGLAYAVQTETGDDYVAGMWRKDLESQLLWRSYGDGLWRPLPRRAQPYRAPTVRT